MRSHIRFILLEIHILPHTINGSEISGVTDCSGFINME